MYSVKTGFATTTRPKSSASPSSDRGTVRALYAYLSSGEHQINFLEGDLILLLGDEATSVHTNANGIHRWREWGKLIHPIIIITSLFIYICFLNDFFFLLFLWIGDRNKGWHYGENIRTGKRGWFPLAYTTAGEPAKDGDVDSGYNNNNNNNTQYILLHSSRFKSLAIYKKKWFRNVTILCTISNKHYWPAHC